jgi:hypothetical protein
MNQGPGGRFGRGRGFGGNMGRGGGGRGRGFRNRYWATGLPGWARFDAGPWGAWNRPAFSRGVPAQQDEMEMLKQQAEYLEDSLGEIRQRMDELEGKK